MDTLPLISDEEDKSSPLKNRIRKNYRHMRKWAGKAETNAFRIYNRDIKEYPLSIDFYAGRFSVHYFSYDRESDEPPEDKKKVVEDALCSLFGVPLESIFWRTRIRREKTEQYEKVAATGAFFEVLEYGVKFKVNLSDYLDTGLFLDHRQTRQIVAAASKGKRLLNLFAYTCSFSVHAAVAGAAFTKSVDMSNTYTAWGADNFALNDLSLANNLIVRDDCLTFLEDEIRARTTYDVIIVDPPTISRSKKMEEMFDIQVDYVSLLTQALRLLAPGGTLFFSTNARKFKFEPSLFPFNRVRDITAKTVPPDFSNHKIHHCWQITH